VLEALADEDGPVAVEDLHERLGMSLLEVADAVRELRRAGLVEVIRSGMDDLVQPAGSASAR
jgi:Mn-dependent DtxR family transcriptional regulator